MDWKEHDRGTDNVTYLHHNVIGVNLAEHADGMGLVNVVPSDVTGIELEANNGETALRVWGTGYAIEVALPIPFIRLIALLDGAISHASH